MIVSKVEDKYYSDCVELINKFYKEALNEYSSQDIKKTEIELAFNKYRDTSYLLVNDKDAAIGVIAGQELPWILTGEKVFQEVMWYLDEDYRRYGVYFLKHVERLLIEDNYKMLVMVCLHNSKTEKLFNFYNRVGFKAMETHFIKTLGAN